MGYWYNLRAWVFKDPGKLIRYVVLFICSIIVIVQLYECFSKLSRPPISTHSYYNLNETIELPAVTICRDPPYKQDVLSNISNSNCTHPKYTNCWRKYPYGEVSLDEFFENSTFSQEETFQQYALNGWKDNVENFSSIHFYMGRCLTLRPRINLSRASRDSGFSILLKHHIDPRINNNKYYEHPPGWHIFLHDQRENFTEINMKGSGRVEYVFAEINEEIEIKLQNQYFSNVQTRDNLCATDPSYSDLKCGEMCIWSNLTDKANCTGPWMYGVSHPECSNFTEMRNLTIEYNKVYEDDEDYNCECDQPCVSRIFSTYIQNRKSFLQPEPSTQIWVYYTTKLISMVEERPSYDVTQFIADVGGSLGFLLGLSVLGLITLLENVTLFLLGGVIKRVTAKQEQKQLQSREGQQKKGLEKEQHKQKIDTEPESQQSTETIDVAVITSKNNDIKDLIAKDEDSKDI